MMYWEEDRQDKDRLTVPDDIVDLIYVINCKMLPLDHAYAFSQALRQAMPWLEEEAAAGIHLIHGAESGNGWYRPESGECQLLHLSRRARMSIRVPKERVEDARALVGQTLDIEGYPLEVGEASTRKLSSMATQFSRYVVGAEGQSEEEFLEHVVQEMRKLKIPVRKIMCGRSHLIRTPEETIHTRAVMVADLDPAHAILLQEQGIGPGRKLGCGLFIPHKGISSIGETRADD
ncbi:MAG: type I-MYXAN CRISPR-associated protein Cas6/Cmx6 [Xanthomonadaceae bacterium]|nr:type I-MYXAN CRISPR-associated protein Cas6/Cmx6 [Xanthomonadaceae bacterium]